MKNSPETLAKRNALRRHWRTTTPLDSFPRVVQKACRVCGETKPHTWSSSFTQTGKPEYKSRCNDCMNVYHSERRKLTRPRVTSRGLDRKFLMKVKAANYLGGRCQRCGYNSCFKALTFHHRVSTEKSFTVSQMLDRAWGILRAELDKCDLLCFNCHMEEHCDLDQEARVNTGYPKRVGCPPHASEEGR